MRDEHAVAEPTVDHDMTPDLEQVGYRPRVPDCNRASSFASDVPEPEAKAPLVGISAHRADNEPGELDGLPPPAMDVYRRNTARTAATKSATTSRAGLAFRATERV